MNNQKLTVIAAVVVIILLLGGGFFVLSSQKKNSTAPTPSIDQFKVEKLSPSDIGLQLIPKVLANGGKQIKVKVSKLSDIKRVDYEITYEADIPKSELVEGESGGRVERGIGGEADIKSGQDTYESEYLDLGSASKNVVRYDTGVKEAKILMKITKTNGKLYQVEDNVSFKEE